MTDRILVVDDLDVWRGIIKRSLERHNYEVDTASSLKTALDLVSNSGPYQVVITDIGLGEKETNTDGLDVLRAVRELSPNTVTIAVSGRAAHADEEKFKHEYGALAYLDRNRLTDMKSFIDLVADAVRRSRDIKGD